MNTRFAHRLDSIHPSTTLAISTKAAELKSQGVAVISFSTGELDFAPGPSVLQAAVDAVQDAKHNHYTPAAGMPELRDCVAAKVQRDLARTTTRSEVLISCGGKQGLFVSFACLLNAGDEVLVISPYWVSYPEQVRFFGATPVAVPTTSENGFQPTREQLDAATTEKTRAIVYSSPTNPTGAVFSEATLRTIADWARDNDAWVVSDEIYEALNFGGPHRSILQAAPDLRERIVMVGGLSKSHAMTGWRLGWVVADASVISAAAKVQSHLNTNTATIVQAAGIAALKGDASHTDSMRTELDARRRMMVERLRALPRVTLAEPMGAFYCFPDISGWFGQTIGGVKVESASDFAAVVLDQAHVAIVPGEGFGAPANVRFSYACSRDDITAGMDRIEKLLTAATATAAP